MMDEEISNKDKYFKGQQKSEGYICFFRHHWIDILREVVYFIIFLILITILAMKIEAVKDVLRGNREIKIFFFTGFLGATVFIHRFFIKMIDYFINIGIITDRRVIDHKKSLFFVDSMDSIDMAQIQNIEKIQNGIMPSLLGFGSIKIFLTASDAIKTFHRIPNARFHFREINRQREARQVALRRGLRRESESINIRPPAPASAPHMSAAHTTPASTPHMSAAHTTPASTPHMSAAHTTPASAPHMPAAHTTPASARSNASAPFSAPPNISPPSGAAHTAPPSGATLQPRLGIKEIPEEEKVQ